jgi:hypothetical protein
MEDGCCGASAAPGCRKIYPFCRNIPGWVTLLGYLSVKHTIPKAARCSQVDPAACQVAGKPPQACVGTSLDTGLLHQFCCGAFHFLLAPSANTSAQPDGLQHQDQQSHAQTDQVRAGGTTASSLSSGPGEADDARRGSSKADFKYQVATA